MVTNRKLTIETLTKLGADKLAELLIAEAAGNRRLKQTLNLAASTQDGPVALGAILRRRLVTLAKSHSMVSYDRGRELIAELDELRTTVVERIGAQDSELAFELLWKFLDLNPSILERVDDSSGRVGSVFRMACDDLGPLAQQARIEPEALAATVFEKVTNNSYGIYDGLVVSLAAALGQKGRAALRGLLLQRRQQRLTEDKRAEIAAGRYLRIRDIDGDRYELLDPAAVALEGKYPLAAVLLRRALIEFTLHKGRTTRYKHAARHVREIDSLNAQIKDYADFETHDQFMARLLRTHPRKTGFWSLLRD
jgi:hypothetical protein